MQDSREMCLSYKKMLVLLPVALFVWDLGTGSSAEPPALSPVELGMIFKLIELKNPAGARNESSCEEVDGATKHALILANKSLSTIPACLPSTLEALDLSNNNLSVIDYDKLAELTMLNTLNLSRNAISELHVTGEFFASLHTLDVSFNLLSRVPKCDTLVNLQWLSLAGNPIKEIQPFAFRCMHYLKFLNLSSTLLGIDDGYGIGKSAFALQATNGTGNLLASNLTMLDLSETFLGNIRRDWTEDLQNLEVLYMSKMPRLKSLNSEEFKPMGWLQRLVCQDSYALSWIDTDLFKHSQFMRHLDFQNCNLTSFNYSNTDGIYHQDIILTGNPLGCTCELSKLLAKPLEIVLLRANETTCKRTDGNRLSVLSLPELYEECQAARNETVTEVEDVMGTTKSSFYRKNTTTQSNAGTGVTAAEDTTGTTAMFYRRNQTAPAFAAPGATSANDITSTAAPYYRNHHPTQAPTAPAASTQVATTNAAVSTTLHSIGSGMILHQSTLGDHHISNSPSTRVASAFTGVPANLPALLFEASTRLPSTASPAATEATKQKVTHANTVKNRRTMAHIPRDYLPDIEEEDEEDTTALANKIVVCDYHPCKHLQTPCHELQRVSPCYCPGLSPGNVIPDPPKLREVSEITDTSAQIQWCAPTSTVHQYQLVYHPTGSENQSIVDAIYVTARQYTLYKLSPDTSYQLCVVAVNKAGPSQVSSKHISRIPCTKFKTKPSYIIILAALCAIGGILLLITIVLAAFLCRKQKGYFVDQYDTRLVSYRNPAFDHHLKIPTFS